MGGGETNYIKAEDTMYKLESTKAIAVFFYLIHKIDKNFFIKQIQNNNH